LDVQLTQLQVVEAEVVEHHQVVDSLEVLEVVLTQVVLEDQAQHVKVLMAVILELVQVVMQELAVVEQLQ
tara:strand:- start:478 stop:687 length:210 start_codon:yes stop_codon:yes gene_type:complete